MLITIWDQLLLHFFVGFSIALLIAIPFLRIKKRRYLFHFGGSDPLTAGSKGLWIIWYVVALAFELGTSILTHRLYVELALSAFEAVAFTAGAFVIDRLAMMFEPTGFYSPDLKTIEVRPVPAIEQNNSLPEFEAVSEKPALPRSEKQSSSWIRNIFGRGISKVASVPGEISGKAAAAVEEYKQQQVQADEAVRAQRKSEAEARRKRFEEITGGR